MREVRSNHRLTARMFVATVAIAGALGLSACGSSDQTLDPNSVAGKVLRGTAEDVKPAAQEQFASRPDCPQLVIRPGTQTHVIYDRGKKNDPTAIRFQATISQTARDCRWATAGQMAIKVGVAGRVLAGPKGGTGDVTLPLRIVVVEPTEGAESTVLFSQLYPIQASVTEAQPSVLWTKVDDNIVVEAKPGLKVLVGFDEGGKK